MPERFIKLPEEAFKKRRPITDTASNPFLLDMLASDKPTVLRDRRGVRWNLHAGTPEENEQLGIRSIQGLFLERFPEFLELFSFGEDGKISEEKQEEAKEFITRTIDTRKKFVDYFGNTPLQAKVPYFEGSYIKAIQKSFGPWGIQIHTESATQLNDDSTPPRLIHDYRGRIVWVLPGNTPEQNKKLAIHNMQALLLQNIPEFDELFPRVEDGGIEESKRRQATEYILAFAGSMSKFTEVFGYSANRHFGTSFTQALRETFLPWGLTFKIKDFKNENIWHGKTKTESIRLARTIFFEEYPEFVELFVVPETQQVHPERAKDARLFILQKIPSQQEFKQLIGQLYKTDAFYQLSYGNILREVFTSLRINFRFKDFRGKRDIWENKTENEIIDICITLFIEEYPKFNTIAKDNKNQLKRLILSRLNSRKKFLTVYPSTLLFKNDFPYFGGSYKIAIVRIFSLYGINFTDEDFVPAQEDEIINPEETNREFLELLKEKEPET